MKKTLWFLLSVLSVLFIINSCQKIEKSEDSDPPEDFYVYDISTESDWDYWVVSTKDDSYLLVDESGGRPLKAYIKPDQSDEGFPVFFDGIGRPEMAVIGDVILLFGGFEGNTFDVGIILPNGEIKIVENNETEINFDEDFTKGTYATDWKKVIKVVSIGVKFISCAGAVTATITTAGAGAGLMFLACSSFIIAVGDEIISGKQDILEVSSDGLGYAASAIGCATAVTECVLLGISIVLDIADNSLEEAQGNDKINETLNQLNNGVVIKPIADFEADKTEIFVGETVKFTDRSTNNPTSLLWEYGIGNGVWTFFGDEKTAEYTFNSEGTYIIRLTASNSAGWSMKPKSFTVKKPELLPVADFEADETEIDLGGTVQFTDLSTNNPFEWNWEYRSGDESWTFLSNQKDPSFNFNLQGVYSIRLTATNSAGDGVEEKTDYIYNGVNEQAPVANFTVTKDDPDVGETIQFTDLSTNNPNQWQWYYSANGGGSWIEFGNREKNPYFSFDSEGTYDIDLIVYNEYGRGWEAKWGYITVTDEDPGNNDIIFNPNLDYGSMTDIDGNTYRTIQIGNQVWMAENLRVTQYADRAAISYAKNASEWDALGEYDRVYTWYNFSETNGNIYGALYSWEAAMNDGYIGDTNPSGVQGVCPVGWHLPSDSEWKELEMFLGMSQEDADGIDERGTNQGTQLKEIGQYHWNYVREEGVGTNESGFTALPGGYISEYGGEFRDINSYGYWWSTSGVLHGDFWSPWIRFLDNMSGVVQRVSWDNNNGYSVRCVKNSGE